MILWAWVALGHAEGTWTAEIGRNHLAHEPVVIAVTVFNDSPAPIEVLDLERHRGQVRFELWEPDGDKQERRSSPDDLPPGTVTLPAAARSTTLLQVPGGALAPGVYGLRVVLEPDEVVLAAGPIRVSPPSQTATDRVRATPEGLLRAWTHEPWPGEAEFILSSASGPSASLGTAVPAARPWLGVDGRGLVWAEGQAICWERGETPRACTALPWPSFEVVGAPVPDGRGHLLVPVWVPAPRVERGRVSLVVLGPGSQGRATPWESADTAGPPPAATGIPLTGGGAALALSRSGGTTLGRWSGDAWQGQETLPASTATVAFVADGAVLWLASSDGQRWSVGPAAGATPRAALPVHGGTIEALLPTSAGEPWALVHAPGGARLVDVAGRSWIAPTRDDAAGILIAGGERRVFQSSGGLWPLVTDGTP